MADDHRHQMTFQREELIGIGLSRSKLLRWWKCRVCGFEATEQFPSQILSVDALQAEQQRVSPSHEEAT